MASREKLNCLKLQDGTIATDPVEIRSHAGGFLYRPLWRVVTDPQCAAGLLKDLHS